MRIRCHAALATAIHDRYASPRFEISLFSTQALTYETSKLCRKSFQLLHLVTQYFVSCVYCIVYAARSSNIPRCEVLQELSMSRNDTCAETMQETKAAFVWVSFRLLSSFPPSIICAWHVRTHLCGFENHSQVGIYTGAERLFYSQI